MCIKKICLSCGTENEDYAKFCQKCGSNQFKQIELDATAILNCETQGTENSVQGQYNQSRNFNVDMDAYQNASQSQQPINNSISVAKKGIKGWQIALIIVGILILAGIGFAAEKAFQNEGYGSNTASNNTFTIGNQNESGTASYSKGNIQDGYYSNEWANIKFKLTEEWPESDENVYSNYENQTTDCGFISLDELSGKQFAVQFEDLSAYIKSYSANDYLNAFEEQLSNQYKNNNIEFNISEIFNINIAGEKYSAIKTNIVNNGMCMYNCCKIVDKHAVIITVSSYDENAIKDTLAQIRKY